MLLSLCAAAPEQYCTFRRSAVLQENREFHMFFRTRAVQAVGLGSALLALAAPASAQSIDPDSVTRTIQVNGISRAASNDGNVMQINRGGVATGIIGIPNRYMHSPVEVVSLKDLENAARLIAEFCLSLDETSDLTPR